MIPVVGVEECANAHLRAIKVPEAAGKRFILVNRTIWFQEVAVTLHDEFHPQGYDFSTKELQRCVMKFASWFKPEIKLVLKSWG